MLVVTTHPHRFLGWLVDLDTGERSSGAVQGPLQQEKRPNLPDHYRCSMQIMRSGEREYLQGEVLEAKLDYWKTKLATMALRCN